MIPDDQPDGNIAPPDTDELDPFAFHGHHIASRIGGLGGDEPADEPIYAFHTPYVAAERGRAMFRVRFTGLNARRGTLVLRVHMLPNEPGSAASMINSERIAFNRLQANHGEVTVSFEGFRNMTFALMGVVPDATDATAEAVTITLEKVEARAGVTHNALQDARATRFQPEAMKSAPHVVATTRPTLAAPVSQGYTLEQTQERTFRTWMKRLGETGRGDQNSWGRVYTLQVLDRYGVLRSGAAGLALLATPDCVPAMVAAAGVDLTIAHMIEDGQDWDGPSRAGICNPATWVAGVKTLAVDFDAIPEDVVNFDFLWSTGVVDRYRALDDILGFLDATLSCLRVGGLAVHILRARPSTAGIIDQDDIAWHPLRPDLDKLAMMLLSMGHSVAQLRPGGLARMQDAAQAREATTLFGIVVRKGQSLV